MLDVNKCKELQAAGFGITSASWVICERMEHFNIYYTPEDSPWYDEYPLEIIPCPSFQEIWDRLPKLIGQKEKTDLMLDPYMIGYPWAFEISIENTSITEAAADLWLLLKSEKLI